MIDVFLTHERFLEISEETELYGSMDAAMAYLNKWCEQRCKFFYIQNETLVGKQTGFIVVQVFFLEARVRHFETVKISRVELLEGAAVGDHVGDRGLDVGQQIEPSDFGDREMAGFVGALDQQMAALEGGDMSQLDEMLLAQAYSLGVGVPASLEKAREWLAIAAEAGDPTAIEMIKFIIMVNKQG